ncbi:MAG TPA: phospho-N-acetylmuramoyl-pentapeptide-transferase [Candidatus Portnoybacteria bacterium]|nr:phospho-N-acetylmuramoyl-pentapeptide-transferase [Candidatus Portnoybacteria bacterium]
MYHLYEISRILGLSALSFIIAFLFTPFWIKFLKNHRLGKQIRTKGAPIFAKFHQKKEGTPTCGGVIIWGTVLLLSLFFFLLQKFGVDHFIGHLNFLSRKETFLPLGALVASALLGLADDIIGIFNIGPARGGGLTVKSRLLLYTVIATFGAWWFYFKLDWHIIHLPFLGNFNIGWWYILVFIFILIATAFSINETDGLDGLAGGVLVIAFGAYTLISYFQGRFDLAAFCGVILGATLAFLWFNIHPAKFFMGDTGAMSLGITLGIVAMLTNQFIALIFIAFIPVLESLSVIIQVLSKKLFHRKIFLSAPIHHHLEGKGWPESQVTMRFWIISWITTIIGLVLVFVDLGIKLNK